MLSTRNYFLLVLPMVTVFSLFSTVDASSRENPRKMAESRHQRRFLWHLGSGTLKSPIHSPDLWFTQKLDHFDPLNSVSWQQRYQANTTLFNPTLRPDSPVFLMVGGEGPINSRWMGLGAWQVYAEKYGALSFQLEHRFYGKSRPFDDMSTERLKFLSSEQALADVAYFIEGMMEKYGLSTRNKWVLFGGSYPGALVAWARSKYPHLVHAAISSSAPLIALADFQAYNRVVEDVLTSCSTDCSFSVHQAALHVEKLIKNPAGGKILSQLFNLCEPLDISNSKDVSTFSEALAGNFDEVVQYNGDNRITSETTESNTVNSIKVDDLCAIMIDRSLGSSLERYAHVNSKMLSLNNQTCLDVSYKNMINDLRNVTFSDSNASGGRQWTYQTCTEFGFYQTSTTQKDLFGSLFNVDYFVDMCVDIFGSDFDKRRLAAGIKRTNIFYGGLDIGAYRVMFVHGSIDPWHVLGITKSNFPRIPAVFINGTAHCADMYPPNVKDLHELKKARNRIDDHIENWLMKQ